jgi:hypothetical protein
MTDSTNGLTNTLQTVQTGDGDNSPLQMSFTQVNISGSLTVNGQPISVDTGSLVTTSSFNAYTSSVNTHLAGLDIETGSLQNQINGLATTGSVSALTGSINSLNAATSSYATTSSVNALTASINSLNAATSSYVTETESGSFVTNVAGGPVSFENLIIVTKGNGSSSQITINNVNNSVSSSYSTNALSASFATNALSASYAPDNSNRNGLITTGSIGGNQSITGSLNVQGTISATSASFQYVTTVYETASVIYSSGSNQLGDASNDTQTLWGTVNLPSGPLVVTGSVIATNFTGSLQGTASNAISSSYSDNSTSASFAQNAISSSQAQNAVSASQAQNAVSSSWANNFDRTGLITTGSISETQSITGSVNVTGSVFVTGSVNLTPGAGSSTETGLQLGGNTSNKLWVSGSNNDVYLRSIADIILTAGNNGNLKISGPGGSTPISASIVGNTQITGSLTVGGQTNLNDNVVISGSLVTNASNKGYVFIESEASKSGSIRMQNYITSSNAVTQSNLIFGSATGAPTAQFTGSITISGSNNIIMGGPRPNTLVNNGTYGYLNGNFNIMAGQSTLGTGSLLRPTTSNNVLMGALAMQFTTGSLPAAQFSNNYLAGQATINHQSGSVQVNANYIAGTLTSTQQVTPGIQNASIGQNNIIGALLLTHASSSITFQQNYVAGSPIIQNFMSSSFSIATNGPQIVGNAFIGSSNFVYLSGSNSSAASRTISNNIIGGADTVVSGSGVLTNNANLNASIVFGKGLIVNGNSGNSGGAQAGGSAFFGKFNDTGSLSLSNDIVFGVGTGTATGTRRTGLWITSGSVVGISGSMAITGSVNQTGGPVTLSGSQFNTNNYIVWNGSQTDPGAMTNFVGAFMTNRNQFTFNNIVQSSLTSGSNFSITTDNASNYSNHYWSSTWAGTEARFTLGNSNGFRNFEMVADQIKATGSFNISGSLGISNLPTSTGSFVVTTDSTGTLTKAPFSSVAAVLFSQGQFVQTGTLTAASGVSGSISYDISGSVNGITLVSGSRLTIPTDGVYNIQFSAQWNADSGTDTGWAWFKKNGTNIANSNSKVQLPNNTSNIMTVNILETAAVGDYYEVAWQNNAGHARLLGEAATGNLPAIPSVITTITQVR